MQASGSGADGGGKVREEHWATLLSVSHEETQTGQSCSRRHRKNKPQGSKYDTLGYSREQNKVSLQILQDSNEL